ncbi:MAG: type III pantothenate kinase [Rikenellaceae bacterium]
MANNLIVDIGNTRVKVAVVCGVEILCESLFGDCAELGAFVPKLVEEWGVERAIVSSTRGVQSGVREVLEEFVADVVVFDAATEVPMKNSYGTPDTLGRDRLAAAVGAAAILDERGVAWSCVAIVDMGTAITVDVVTKEGGFEGGTISPGVAMRFAALHQNTATLPLVEPSHEELLEAAEGVAKSTREAIVEGVLGGVAYEIDSRIVDLQKKFGEINVFLTGGDAKNFEKRIKNPIFASQVGVVSVGLNRILEYNEK